MIPILDLKAQYHLLKTEIDVAIERVLESGTFILGPNVEAFEAEIAHYLGIKHAVSLNSGTDALHLALRALDIGPGDEVITSPFTFAATTEAIGIVGATPVFVDVDPISLNLDPALIEGAITARTRAILPVHLYGGAANMNEIQRIAARHHLHVVEDAAQAIGAEIDGRKIGTIGIIGCYSFFPSKNLGAYGDGGLASTNDQILADRLRALRAHGGRKKYYHDELGVNSRLDEIQAAILRVKLPHLDNWILARRNIAARYYHGLSGVEGVSVPPLSDSGSHVYHQYTIQVPNRDQLRDLLATRGVQTMVYYPVPLHLQKVYTAVDGRRHDLPNAERAARQVVSLPIYPELEESAQDDVISAVKHAIARGALV